MWAEFFEIVNDRGEVIGIAPRQCCHGNPALLHRTAHVVVMDADGRILLQKRAMDKDIQPGKWDTSVGGHLQLGEDFLQAARREATEEIGLPADCELKHIFDLPIRNSIESENTRVFITVHGGPFHAQPEEIDELRFWTWPEIRDAMGKDLFTPNLERELKVLERQLAVSS